jgi:RimJ/RimL family protein N-acetyltransferase
MKKFLGRSQEVHALGSNTCTCRRRVSTPRRWLRAGLLGSALARRMARGVHMAGVALRPVKDGDLDALFEQMRDPEGVRMAAFTPEDPDDRNAFDAHMSRVRSSPDITLRAVMCDGHLAGSIAAFPAGGQTEVTYWIERAAWGKGIATRALALLLELVTARPLYARAASDNAGSLRVLQKCGFQPVGTEKSFAAGRNEDIEETVLRLDN